MFLMKDFLMRNFFKCTDNYFIINTVIFPKTKYYMVTSSNSRSMHMANWIY